MTHPQKSVVLIGMMGVGKTAVGKALAQRLNLPFMDSDSEIEAAANATIAEIFEQNGEAFFRHKEAQVIERLLNGPVMVLSVGGGAFMQQSVRDMINKCAISFFLDAPLDVLWKRVSRKQTRPLLQTHAPKETLKRLYDERLSTYAMADVRVPSDDDTSISQMAGRVKSALIAHLNKLEKT